MKSNIVPQSITLDLEQTAALVGVSTGAIRKWAREGTFPKGFKLNHCRRWNRQSILDWLQEKEAIAAK
jgi:predicted DNA-binding transcriptional regulator AlpA